MNPLHDDCWLMWTLLSTAVLASWIYWRNGRKAAASFAWVGCFLVYYCVWFVFGTSHHPPSAWIAIPANLSIIWFAGYAKEPLKRD